MTPPIVSATDAPAGTEAFPVKWVTLAVPDLGVMRAAIARLSGTAGHSGALDLTRRGGVAPNPRIVEKAANFDHITHLWQDAKMSYGHGYC